MKLAVTQKATELIASFEGFDQPGSWPGARSGVTIGCGYDLGYYSERKFRSDWAGRIPQAQIDRLAHAIGVTGSNARTYCRGFGDIHIPKDQALTVFRTITLPDFAERAGNTFPGAENLPADAQGALVSLVFNRGTDLDWDKSQGDRRKEMRNIYSALKNWKNGDEGRKEVLQYIAAQLRSMKRIWAGQGEDGLLRRREAEAKLVESTI